LKQLVETMLEKSSKGENYVREDREFHHTLFSSTGNMLLEQLLKAFWDLYEQSNIVKNHANLQAVAHTHRQMLEAIVRKNVDQAIALMNQQFADVRYHISMLLAANAAHGSEGGDS
jgi:DNA-binding FadR family transcriptional regulator